MAEDKPSDIPLASSPPTDTGYIKGDDNYTRWRNTFSLLMGRLTPEGKEQYRVDRDRLFEKDDCQRCEKHRDFLLNYSPIVRFMSAKISQLHGDLDASNIRCQRCTFRHGGGFSPDVGIKICANEMRNRGHLEDTLAHEMIHAYDYLRFKVEWTNLRHAACTEIRASNLSGECRLMREWFTRGQWRLTQQHQECVRRRAIISVTNHPLCGDKKQAEKIVGEVFESCFADTRPFDEIYR